MIHFDAKHHKSEAKMKAKQAKIKQKIEAKRKLNEKIDKNVFFFTRNKIGKRNNAKNIEFCFF
jgi:uncharacterized protein YaiL (DUF2058 family)